MKNTAKIQLFNTLSNKTETFEPIRPGEVSMYHCGPTVYDYPHIGNIRSYILADTIRRTFEYNNYKVNQVINITDVGHLTSMSDEGFGDDGEDKVEKKARTSGQHVNDIINFYTKAFFDDLKAVNVEIAENKITKSPATLFPKATDHISEQIALIQKLEKKGYTYEIHDGIYFDTSKFSGYGKLGSIDLAGLMEGARLDVSEEKRQEKRNITDFVLWKFSPTGEGAAKRLQEWQSPWGIGAPGWHIECSAMSAKYLGETFDIHTGGIDHIPVHHNNEIAQSESAHDGRPLAHYWLHNAFVNIKDGKMSKSKGDFLRLQTLVERNISPLAYRYWILGSQYHTQVEFSFEALEASAVAYWKLVDFVFEISDTKADGERDISTTNKPLIEEYTLRFTQCINDDLNTAQALALIWDITRDTTLSSADKRALILDFDTVLGLDLQTQVYKLRSIRENLPEEIKERLNEREFARREKRWADSDKIRDEILTLGFSVRDTADTQVVTPVVRI